VNYGSALRRNGHAALAEAQYRAAIQIDPKNLAAIRNLAGLLLEQKRTGDVLEVYRAACAASPDSADLHFHYGDLLLWERFTDDAVEVCARAVALAPNVAAARNNYGVALRLKGRAQEAIEQYQAAIRLDPKLSQAYGNLGNALSDQARLDEALEAYRHGLDVPAAHSNLLYHLFCLPQSTGETILNEHRAWERRHAAQLTANIRPHNNDRSADRRLRIAFLSPDLRKHSVAYFLEPILSAHDHQQFEVFCYADIVEADDFSKRMQAHADHWVQTISLPDAALAEQIRADKIDILIDLAGHTSRGRMIVLATKPAPILISYLGYPGTTGLSTIDYRITDAVSDPPGMSDAFHSEKLIRLPQGFLCYRPDDDAPPVAERDSAGPITFGSFNNLGKLSTETMRLWGLVLGAVPDSRLLLKYRSLGDRATCDVVAEQLERHGIPRERLDLLPHAGTVRDHLGTYSRVDIALDPTPYNGTTTTCEALWMGVPVISLAGTMHHARVGTSILTQIGLPELIASSLDDYVNRARELASDRLRLGAKRRSLRERLRTSPLMDAASFTRAVEAEYRRAWRAWCSRSFND
jgi:predicted O-linked N-acetylglucosamine transferase (SPINDLY family)